MVDIGLWLPCCTVIVYTPFPKCRHIFAKNRECFIQMPTILVRSTSWISCTSDCSWSCCGLLSHWFQCRYKQTNKPVINNQQPRLGWNDIISIVIIIGIVIITIIIIIIFAAFKSQKKILKFDKNVANCKSCSVGVKHV